MRHGATLRQKLLDAFTASSDAYEVRMCFFAVSLASLRKRLPHQGRPPYGIETIYRTTSTPVPSHVDVASLRDQEVMRPPLCLVAAKVLYFGAG